MPPFSSQFQDALDGGETPVLLIKVTLIDNTTVVALCSGDRPVKWGGITYLPENYIGITALNASLGSEITTCNIDLQMGGRITQDDVLYRWPNASVSFYAVFPI